MQIKEIITELFKDSSIPWKWSFKGSEEVSANFQIGDIPYRWYAVQDLLRTPVGTWTIEFSVDEKYADDNHTTSYGLTATGNAALVMSTVVDITRSFIKEYKGKIQVIRFDAMEDSRQDLYTRMVQRLLPTWRLIKTGEHFSLTDPVYLAKAKPWKPKQ